MTCMVVDFEDRSGGLDPDESRKAGPAPPLERLLVGSSRGMRRVRKRIDGLAPMHVPVLVHGEPGTGRDCVAEALHRLRDGAEVALARIACASPEAERVPRDAPAVYLDEVGRLSARAQDLWLEQICAARQKPASHRPRVYASTSEDLLALAQDGTFHAALARELNRFTVLLPPLRERKADLPALVSALLERIGARFDRPGARVLPAGLARMKQYRWPGNVRELEKMLEQLTAYSKDGRITGAEVEDAFNEDPRSVAARRRKRERQECEELAALLAESGGNINAVADKLSLSRTAVTHRAQKWGLMPKPRRRSRAKAKAKRGSRPRPE